METQSIDFVQKEEGDAPPTDYFITLSEDIHVDGIVAELALGDIFTVSTKFEVEILNGMYHPHSQICIHLTLQQKATSNAICRQHFELGIRGPSEMDQKTFLMGNFYY